MMDYLDALIDRHMNAAPQIIPRLPSIYEPEVSHGGWDFAASESAPEMEASVFAGPIVPMKETARTQVEPTEFQPSTIPTTQVGSPAAVEPMQENAGPGFVTPAAEEKSSVTAGLHEPESSFSPKAKTFDPGLAKSLAEADTQIVPVMGEVRNEREAEHKEHASPHREETSEDLPFVNKARVGNDRDSEKATLTLKEPVISLSHTEQRVNAGPTETSSADLITPLTVRMRRVHKENRVEQADNRPFLNKELSEHIFSPPTQERVEIRELHSACERHTTTFSKTDQGLLKPSTALITPVIPSVAGPELLTSQPEPVINVTIGRVEVRATVPPQKQSPKPGNRPPVMGLDEYLRHRSGRHDG
jgi:hypothetical protein